MARTNRWFTESRRTIRRALDEGRARGLEGKDLVKHVDAAYPWGERAMWPYRQWLEARKQMLGSLLPDGRGTADTGLDRDYFARLDGPGSDAWEAMIYRKRVEMSLAGIPADDWTDEAVADWRPAKEESTDGR